jgi:hypothetical protein
VQRQLGDSQIKQGNNFTGNCLRLLANAVWKNQAQSQTNRPASRLVGREQFIYRIPVTHVWLEGKSQCVCLCSEKEAPDRESCEAMHYNVLQKMWCWILYGAVFRSVSLQTELLELKVTTEFQRQCHKNLLSAQCVNCSGRVVTINVVILTSKFI